MNAEHNDLVPVRFYDDPLDAHMARCLLENEGLKAFVHDEHIIGLNRAFSYALGQVKLKVATEDRTQALRILEEVERRPYLNEADQPICCPSCGSTDLANGVLRPRSFSGFIHWALALLFSVFPMSMDRFMQCSRCGHLFKRPEEGGNTTGRPLVGDRPVA